MKEYKSKKKTQNPNPQCVKEKGESVKKYES